MRTGKRDIYDLTGLPRPRGAAGTLTAYVPEGPDMAGAGGRLRPGALILPGGGYTHCSPREAEPIALKFCAMGWAAFVLEYSCAPHLFPTALREAAAAMAHLRKNAPDMGVDPHMLAAVGFSAGGHLAGTLGTLFDAPEVSDIAAPELIRPDALGLCYPVAVSHGRTHAGSFQNLTGGDSALWERLSIDKLVRPDMCPVFLWHTRDDRAVPCRNSLVLAQALEDAGVPFALHIFPHGRHGLATADIITNVQGDLPAVSGGVTGWPELMMGFFNEMGLAIHDGEVNV